MQPNFYAGIFLALVAAIFATKHKLKWTWRLFAVSQLFGATSLAALPALGGASLTMPQAGVAGIIFAALMLVALRDSETTRRTFALHATAFGLIAYTIVISIYAPRLFAGATEFIQMRPDVIDGYAVPSQLEPRSTNITHTLYLTGSLLTGVAVSLVFARALPASEFRNWMLVVAAVHAGFGAIDWICSNAGFGRVLEFLKNGNYLMLDQEMEGVKRLSGQLPEPSAYAGFAAPFAVFAAETWFRDRKPDAGWIALAAWTMTLVSTSSTGIFAAVVYGMVLLPRFMLSRGRFGAKVTLWVILAGVALLVCGVALFNQPAYEGMKQFILTLTVEKGASQSGIERGEMAAQGWTALRVSYGLGTGAGSFRSSSLAMAVLGSVGVVGTLLMVAFIGLVGWRVIQRGATDLQRSAAWAALFAIVPALVAGPTPDPGFSFGLFAGFALSPQAARFFGRPEVFGENAARTPDAGFTGDRGIGWREAIRARRALKSSPPH